MRYFLLSEIVLRLSKRVFERQQRRFKGGAGRSQQLHWLRASSDNVLHEQTHSDVCLKVLLQCLINQCLTRLEMFKVSQSSWPWSFQHDPLWEVGTHAFKPLLLISPCKQITDAAESLICMLAWADWGATFPNFCSQWLKGLLVCLCAGKDVKFSPALFDIFNKWLTSQSRPFWSMLTNLGQRSRGQCACHVSWPERSCLMLLKTLGDTSQWILKLQLWLQNNWIVCECLESYFAVKLATRWWKVQAAFSRQRSPTWTYWFYPDFNRTPLSFCFNVTGPVSPFLYTFFHSQNQWSSSEQ